jgi:uncharacterized protein YbgA (DUF1722 family)
MTSYKRNSFKTAIFSTQNILDVFSMYALLLLAYSPSTIKYVLLAYSPNILNEVGTIHREKINFK